MRLPTICRLTAAGVWIARQKDILQQYSGGTLFDFSETREKGSPTWKLGALFYLSRKAAAVSGSAGATISLFSSPRPEQVIST